MDVSSYRTKCITKWNPRFLYTEHFSFNYEYGYEQFQFAGIIFQYETVSYEEIFIYLGFILYQLGLTLELPRTNLQKLSQRN